MNELSHIILSLQIMFGSRRAMGAIVALLLLCGVGYLGYTWFSNPARPLERADAMWDRDEIPEAIRQYKSLLRKRELLEPSYALLPREERPRLYRRIISHETVFGTRADARDWITVAYNEGINFEKADFERPEVYQLWLEVVGDIKDGGKQRNLLDEALERD